MVLNTFFFATVTAYPCSHIRFELVDNCVDQNILVESPPSVLVYGKCADITNLIDDYTSDVPDWATPTSGLVWDQCEDYSGKDQVPTKFTCVDEGDPTVCEALAPACSSYKILAVNDCSDFTTDYATFQYNGLNGQDSFLDHFDAPTGYLNHTCQDASDSGLMIQMIKDWRTTQNTFGRTVDWGDCLFQTNVVSPYPATENTETGSLVAFTCEEDRSFDALLACGQAQISDAPIDHSEQPDGQENQPALPSCNFIRLYDLFGDRLFDLTTEAGRNELLLPIDTATFQADLKCSFLNIDLGHAWEHVQHMLHHNSPPEEEGSTPDGRRRGGQKERAGLLWDSGIIPYSIDMQIGDVDSRGSGPSYTLDQAKLDATTAAINAAVVEWNKYTCIKFVPHTTEPHYISFVFEDGCWSYIGDQAERWSGKQKISLGAGCATVGLAIHEMMHAVGFNHEHERPDREDFVHVTIENVDDVTKRSNFPEMDESKWDPHAVSYDTASIMAYYAYDFTGPIYDPIITRIDDNTAAVTTAQRVTLTLMDSEQISKLYATECAKRTPTATDPVTPTPTYGYAKFRDGMSCGENLSIDLSSPSDRGYGQPVAGVHSKQQCALATLEKEECYAGIFQWNDANFQKFGGCERKYLGCFSDGGTGNPLMRQMGIQFYAPLQDDCERGCKNRGYRYFGRQNWGECWCGNAYGPTENSIYRQLADSDCNCEANGPAPGHNGLNGIANQNGQCFGTNWKMAIYDTCGRPDSATATAANIAAQKTEQTCGCCQAHFGFENDLSNQLNFITGTGYGAYESTNPYPKPSLVKAVGKKCSESTRVFDDARTWKDCEYQCHAIAEGSSLYSGDYAWSPRWSSTTYSQLSTGSGIGCQCCKTSSPVVPSAFHILYTHNPDYTGTYSAGRRRTDDVIDPTGLPSGAEADQAAEGLGVLLNDKRNARDFANAINQGAQETSLEDDVGPLKAAEEQCQEAAMQCKEEVQALEEKTPEPDDFSVVANWASVGTFVLAALTAFSLLLTKLGVLQFKPSPDAPTSIQGHEVELATNEHRARATSGHCESPGGAVRTTSSAV